MQTVLLIVNSPKFFLSHWLGIALASKAKNLDIQIATRSEDNEIEKIESYGFKVHIIPLSRSGLNLISEFYLILKLINIIRQIKPTTVHLITIKPVIYGGIAARICRTPNVIAAVTGLGYVFLNNNKSSVLLKTIVKFLYRVSLAYKRVTVVFENIEDRFNFISLGIINEDKCVVIDGAGVDLSSYPHLPEPPKPIKFIFASRLLKDKGVLELLESIKACESLNIEAKFIIAGDVDPENPASLTEEECHSMQKLHNLQYLGYRNDIPKLFSESHVVILPSYREGLPKVLIEAAACGRAVITTDAPGCKHVILPNVTGLLVEARNSTSLTNAIIKLVNEDVTRVRLGVAGRELAEEKYSLERISEKYTSLYIRYN